jgi:hypothetical protein
MTRTTSFTGDYIGTEVTVLPDRLSDPAREAARRLAAAPNLADQPDFLLTAATEISQGRPVGIGGLGEDVPVALTRKSVFPEVVEVDTAPETITGEVRAELAALHRHLWDHLPEPSDRTGFSPVKGDEPPAMVGADPLLEIQAPEASDAPSATPLPSLWSEAAPNPWHRVRPTLLAAASVLTNAVTQQAAPGLSTSRDGSSSR